MENLEHTKKTADEIELKVIESKKTSSEIDKVIHLKPIIIDTRLPLKAREFYRGSAARASLLYFVLNDLNRINPMYQFSLKAFSVVFDVAIKVPNILLPQSPSVLNCSEQRWTRMSQSESGI